MRLFFVLLAAALVRPLAAQPVEPDTTLPRISVVATRTAAPPAHAPARVTVLDAAEAGASSVADLLDARSAVFVRRVGPGGLASLSLRGTNAAQTLVLLDGHRITDPQLGQLDLSLLPTVLLDRVELMHGAGSALYGTDGIGGVVDLRTARAEEDRLELTSSVGAYGERSASGLAALDLGDAGLVVAAEVRETDGDFPYFDPNAGLGGATLRREGADRAVRSLYARLDGARSRTDATAAVWIGAAERGLPGTVGGTAEGERQDDEHLRLWGDVTHRLGAGSVRLGGLVQRASVRYVNPSLGLDETGRATLASAEVEAQALLGRRWLVAGGVSGGLGTAEHPSLADDAAETRLGAFVHATGDFGRLLVYPALRADAYLRTAGAERTLAALSPRLGLNLQPVAAWPLRLKASAGLAFRAPTFNDRFWQPGGNPDLRPERGWTADLGAHVRRGGASAEVTLFASRLRDQIVWQPTGNGLQAPENLSRTRTLGLEATASHDGLRLGTATLGGGLTYTLTDARDRSRPGSSAYGHQLRYVPRHQFKLHTDASHPLGARTRLGLDLGGRLTGARPVRADGSLDLPAAFTLDARLHLHHRLDIARAALTLGVENVLDADVEIVRGYPMPPRHARLRLHLSF